MEWSRGHEREFGAGDCKTTRERNRVVQSCFMEKKLGPREAKITKNDPVAVGIRTQSPAPAEAVIPRVSFHSDSWSTLLTNSGQGLGHNDQSASLVC